MQVLQSLKVIILSDWSIKFNSKHLYILINEVLICKACMLASCSFYSYKK